MASEAAKKSMEQFLAGQLAEEIYVLAPDAVARPVSAIVERNTADMVGNTVGQTAEITLLNDDLLGISSAEVNTRDWRVSISARIRQKVEERTVRNVISQDPDFITLGVM